MKIFDRYEGFILDMDGTLYRGNKVMEGAAEVVNFLISIGKDVIFVSNKTTETGEDYWSFLSKNGFNVKKEQIITATHSVRKYLKKNFSEVVFYAIGGEKFIRELTEEGARFSGNPEEVDFVIVTLDMKVNFEKLEIAAKSLEKGAHFFAANIDDTCPVEDGEITDAGAIVSTLEKRTGRKLEKHFGKPSPFIFELIKSKMKYKQENYLIVGDRLLTDIKMGNDFGIDTALVSTGVKNFFELYENIVPTYRFPSIKEIMNYRLK